MTTTVFPSSPSTELSDEQKNYLQGFVVGAGVGRSLHPDGNGAAINGRDKVLSAPPEPMPTGPEAIHIAAQNRFIAAGKKLCAEEKGKRDKNPLDRWDDMDIHARENRFPKGGDVFAWKSHGLFYVAPAQDSFMCRLRFHGGILRSSQAKDLAEIADRFGGGFVDATTRANLQIREIKAAYATDLLMSLQDSGIVSKGAGADNIRNITASPTAGIDVQELIDTRPLSAAMHHYILNHREMYGLPRKFNIAFDGGGIVSSLEDTNDIGFAAVRVGDGKSVPPGIYFRLALGGITGHEDFARDTGILLQPEQCVPMAAAIVRIFIDNGDRTDRKRARLKYVLDAWGFDKFMSEVQNHLSFEPARLPVQECEPRGAVDRWAHIDWHPQKQDDLHYVGIVLPVGRITAEQLRGLALIADRFGSGTLRLTVWQNLLISDVASKDVDAVKSAIEMLGLDWSGSSVRAGLVACTGKAGCRFAAAHTKQHAMQIADHLDASLQLDSPLNIHLTGCSNSCAQHYIGDIGLLGTNVEVGDDIVEGYHLFIGGGSGAQQGIARELIQSVRAEDVPTLTETLLRLYLVERNHISESFVEWSRRQPIDQLRAKVL